MKRRHYLLGASLNGAVLAGHVLAVPVVCGTTGQTQVGVTLPHCQVTGTLLGVALSFTPATRETVLTCRETRRRVSEGKVAPAGRGFESPACLLTLGAALAKLLAEILSSDAGTRRVAGLPRVVTWLVIIHVIGRAICSSETRRTNR